MANFLACTFILLSLTNCAFGSLSCPSSSIPSSGILRGASIYRSNTIYRISLDVLPTSNFSLISSGKAKLATSDSPQCSMTNCMFELATDQRMTDMNILHQNNFLNGIAPGGYTKLSVTTPMYCVSIQGDCGADVPIYRYTKPIAQTLNNNYAYSFDSSVQYAGFTREAAPICYGWSTNTAYSNCGDGIATSRLAVLSTYINSNTGANRDHFTTTWTPATLNGSALSSYTKSSDLGLIATSQSAASDTLQCNCLVKLVQMIDFQSGLGGTVTAPGLFGRLDHKLIVEGTEPNGFGEAYVPTGEVLYCVFQKGTCGATVGINKWFDTLNLDTIYTLDGDLTPPLARSDGTLCYIWPTNYTLPQICQPAPTVTNGLVTYQQAGSTTSFLQGTTATLMCTSGYGLSGASTLTCAIGAVWTPTTFGTCNEVCPQLPSDPNGIISYSQPGMFVGTTATLVCTDSVNFQVRGSATATCQSGKVWSPTTIGVCSRSCQAVNVPNGLATYRLADGVTQVGSPPYYDGYQVVLTCNSGTTLVGNNQATCSNSVFTPALGSCIVTNG